MSDQARPSTVQDLVRHLADTLVENEVMKPMDQIGWSHGTPPPPASADNPTPGGAPTQPATPAAAPAGTTPAAAPAEGQAPVKADTPRPIDLAAQFESLRDANGMILGKYKTVDEAIKGVGHAVQMAKTAFDRERAATTEVARLTKELEEKSRQTPPAATPAAVQSQSLDAASQAVTKAQAAYDAVLSKVVEEGGTLDEDAAKRLSAAQRELARAEARMAAEEALLQHDGARTAEQAKWDEVNRFMEKEHPESLKFADEIGLFVQSDPLIADAVQALVEKGKEQQAAVFAWKSFQNARDAGTLAATVAAAAEKEVQMQAADQVRKEAVDKARVDAGIPGSSAGGVHETTAPLGPSQEEIDRLAAGMRTSGMTPGSPAAVAWREAIIGSKLPKELFPN